MGITRTLVDDTAGAMAAEYALMLGVFCLGCACATVFYSHQISAALNRISGLIFLGGG
jgi:hypothetical protein